MKIFIAGARGQLGRDCLTVFGRDHEVRGLDLPELDIAEPASVRVALDAFRPDVLINAAAFTRVDAAEMDREAAHRANADGPRVLAEYMEQAGGRLVHLSTDYVFAGDRPPPAAYTEVDPTGPVSWYGRTKREGELAVQQAAPRHLIFRTAWLYGATGHNFLRAILRAAIRRPGQPLRVVNDQWGSPTWSWRLAEQMKKALEGDGQGLYHATAEGYGTWHQVAVEWLRLLGLEHEVQAITTAEYPTLARRPANSILENARLKAEGLNLMRPWVKDLAEFARRHGAELMRETESAK